VVHVANDGPEPLTARLRVALYRDLEVPVGGGETIVELAPHGTVDHDVEALVGHFVDAAWAYRFGPPAQDAIVATLERLDGPLERPLAQSVRLPAGRAVATAARHDLGLTASVESTDGDRVELAVSSRRLAYGVRLDVPGFVPGDDAFAIEPGHTRHVELRARHEGTPFSGGTLSALDLAGTIPIAI
jgi:beta-mannosidase